MSEATEKIDPRVIRVVAATLVGGIAVLFDSTIVSIAVRTLAVVVLTIGLVPLLFHVLPGLAEVRVGPVPVVWLVLGVATYPFLLLLAWRYVRRAERNEEAFAELMQEVER